MEGFASLLWPGRDDEATSRWLVLRRGRASGPHERAESGVNLAQIVQANGEWDSALSPLSWFGGHDDKAVAVDANQLGFRGHPAAAEDFGEQQQIGAQTFAQLGHEFRIVVGERVRIGSGKIVGPQPLIDSQIIDPAHACRNDPQPREIE